MSFVLGLRAAGIRVDVHAAHRVLHAGRLSVAVAAVLVIAVQEVCVLPVVSVLGAVHLYDNTP
ncbi:hypothetical protein GCM10009798_07920 [Nocardioides panacihumi]|uniref:Uncharacterized protein n=1 Tax=Nocardioides panacihumi TaxID=400774 RepID=A0ABN2QGZ4_9ACTN